MTVVRITIKKVLSQSDYFYRLSTFLDFASEYWVQTNASFPSPQLEAYAQAIAQAESRLHPSCVLFNSAVVKLMTPGLSAEALRGQFSHYGLDRLRGQVAMAEDDALAFPPVVADFVRTGMRGRAGRLLIPHVLTAAEWLLYSRTHVLPLRFQRQSMLDQASAPPILSFSQELLAAIHPCNGVYILPIAPGDAEQSPRRVSEFVCVGFRVGPAKSKKKKPKKSSPRRFDLGEEETQTASPLITKSVRHKVPVVGVVYLLQSGPHYKIGKSINPDKRVGQIKLQLPFPTEVIHTIRAANPSEAESYWHRRFASLRQNGEWFLLTDAEVSAFKAVSEM